MRLLEDPRSIYQNITPVIYNTVLLLNLQSPGACFQLIRSLGFVRHRQTFKNHQILLTEAQILYLPLKPAPMLIMLILRVGFHSTSSLIGIQLGTLFSSFETSTPFETCIPGVVVVVLPSLALT